MHQNPGLRVYVHEKGAPHLVAPERLIASATRLWGDEMDRLWGEFRPVPEHALTILRGGERFTAGGRDLDVAYTPGHASHHVSYYNADSGVAFVGDTAGIRRAERGFVLPPTPPPDIDLELWRDSLARIGRWSPDDAVRHAFRAARAGGGAPDGDGGEPGSGGRPGQGVARAARGRTRIGKRGLPRKSAASCASGTGEVEAQAYEVAGRFDLNWRGLARYWRKKAVGAAG